MNTQAIEAALCGLVMRDRAALAEAIAANVEPKHLTDPFLSRVFEACTTLWEQGKATDIVSLCHLLGFEHQDRVRQLRLQAPLTQAHGGYISAVIDRWRQTELEDGIKGIAKLLGRRGEMEALGPIVDQMVELVLAAKGKGPAMKTTSLRDALGRALDQAETRLTASGVPGVPSGFPNLDRAIYGFQAGFVYVLGARTAVGKTTMAATIATNAAELGHKVAFVTVEMADTDLADKILTRAAKVNTGRYLSGDMGTEEMDRIAGAAGRIADLPIVFVEAQKPSLDVLAFEIMRLVRIEGVKLVVVDYLQLFDAGDEKSRFRNAREEVKTVSARLKSLARSLGVPILVLSQLNRQAPEHGEPELIHIAESDQIVRDADVVLFLYCDDKDDYWLTVAKNRRGQRGRIRLTADLATNSFSEGAQ